MRFNVAELIARAGQTRKRELVLAPLFPPVGLEADVRAIYLRVVRQWGRVVLERVMPEYVAAIAEGVRDAPADPGGAVEDAGKALNRLVLGLGPELEDWVVRVEQWHRGKFGQQFTATGVNLSTLLGQGDVAKSMQAVLGENTALIRSLDDQLRNGISGAVFRGLTQRDTAATVAKEIRNITAVGRRRAELIAADQLQKLTGRLDQERQEQLGITQFEWAHSRKLRPRPEHVVRDGKRYKWTDPVAKNDPPGRAIRCGCRARAVVDLDDEVAEAPTVAAPPPPAPEPAPAPRVAPPRAPAAPAPLTGYRSVVNPALTTETLKVGARLPLQKELTARLKQSAADPRYATEGKWQKRSEADNGRAVFSADWTDEAVSAVTSIAPELDALADQLGVPRLRGYKTTAGSQNADMGGGILAVSPGEFNARMAAAKGGGVDNLAGELSAQAESLMAQQVALRAPINEVMSRLNELRYGSPEWAAVRVERDALSKKWESLQRKRVKLKENARRAVRQNTKPQVTWKQGDDPKGKPWSVAQYYPEGIDRVRSTMFHEFGHHVHQQFKREGGGRFASRPVESRLTDLWRGPAGEGRAARQASEYATTNQYEWFAENFSLYVMGRTPLVDPILREFIEDIFSGRF